MTLFTIPVYTHPNQPKNYGLNNPNGTFDCDLGEPCDPVWDQETHSPKLNNNESIVIRTAYVTIQPYDLPMRIPDLSFGQMLSSGASLRSVTAPHAGKHGATRTSSKQRFLAATESESSQSMRSSADFFKASKPTGRLGEPTKPVKPARAKSSVLINNDLISFDDLRRTSQSMTSMGKLFRKIPSKMQSAAAKIRQQNMEYASLLESLQKTSDKKVADRILRQMESCKSNIRSSIKHAMFEQRKNQTERFDPIPIALFDNLTTEA